MAIKKDKLSDAQKAELEKLRPFIARQGLRARMNGGNWRSALDAILSVEGYEPLYRLRTVRDVQDPAPDAWRGPLPTGLPLYNFIEWLELDTRSAKARPFAAALHTALQAAKIPVAETQGGLRILAYTREGSDRRGQ